MGDLQAAEAHFRSAIAVDAQRAVAWKDLGAALDAQDRRNEAIEASATAVRLDEAQGVRSNSFVNLAIELAADGRLGEAIALHERMLPDRPFPYGHLAYAQALLKAGRLREGWEQYEFRFLCEPLLSARRDIQRPSWSGQQLAGKDHPAGGRAGRGRPHPVHPVCAAVQGVGRHCRAQRPRGRRSLCPGLSRRRSGSRAWRDRAGFRLRAARGQPAARICNRLVECARRHSLCAR